MSNNTFNQAVDMKKDLCDKRDDIKLEISKRREILERKLSSTSD